MKSAARVIHTCLLACIGLCCGLADANPLLQAAVSGTDSSFLIPPLSFPSALADSLYARGHYYDAATEYKRCLFISPSDRRALNGLIRACAMDGNFEEVDRLLELGPVAEDSLGWLTRYTIGRAYFEHGQTERARAEFADLLALAPGDSYRSDVYRRLGWMEADVGSFSQAAKQFNLAGDSGLAVRARQIRLPEKNADLAMVMSSIIPGSGELYAGNLRLGLTSMLVDGGLAAVIVYSIAREHYVDAAIIFSFLWTRFYFGSRNNARDCTDDYNRRIREAAIRDLAREKAQGQPVGRP